MPERINAADLQSDEASAEAGSAPDPSGSTAGSADGSGEHAETATTLPALGLHVAVEVTLHGGLPAAAGLANAIAVGIDSVDVPRLAAVLERTPAMRERCFTTTELVDAATGGDEVGHLGICFAAKEAVAKALGCGIGPVGFHDIELVRSETGAPELVLSGAAAPLAAHAGIEGWLVSATHTDTVAQTVVIAVRSDA